MILLLANEATNGTKIKQVHVDNCSVKCLKSVVLLSKQAIKHHEIVQRKIISPVKQLFIYNISGLVGLI